MERQAIIRPLSSHVWMPGDCANRCDRSSTDHCPALRLPATVGPASRWGTGFERFETDVENQAPRGRPMPTRAQRERALFLLASIAPCCFLVVWLQSGTH